MQQLLDHLRVPPEYPQYSEVQSDELVAHLNKWKQDTHSQLSALASLVEDSELSLDEQSSLVFSVAQYAGDGPWVLSPARISAEKILSTKVIPTIPLLQSLLATKVRPVFQANLHPNLNPDTGRKLARAAPSQDLYTSQPWKESCPGIGNVVLWAVKQLNSEDYERMWHLIIPPMMTLLDDYDSTYKIYGIQIAAEMLKTVPMELLRRTGVGELMFSSLKSTLTFLNNPKTADIIRAGVPTMVNLVTKTNPSSSGDKGKQQFDQLASILGDGIIGNVWLYASRDVSAIRASIDVLPIIVEALGIGSVRYLKSMIHQLLHPLRPPPPGAESPLSSVQVEEDMLKLSCLRALKTIIHVCQPRIQFWKGTILDSLARCWVHEVDKQGSEEIKRELQDLIRVLRLSCPSIANNELKRLEAADLMFGDLLKS